MKKMIKTLLFSALFFTGFLFTQNVSAQCANPNSNHAIGAAMSNEIVRNFVVPYRRGNFWNETVTVTFNSDNTITVAFLYEPACRTETPPCYIPNQIVGATFDCDYNLLGIFVS